MTFSVCHELLHASFPSETVTNSLNNQFSSLTHAPCHTSLIVPFYSCRCRCLRSVGHGAHREHSGEVPVRTGGVREEPVPEPAHPLRQAAAASALAAIRVCAGHRTALLRAAGGQDAHRDPHPGHATERRFLQLALHGHPMTDPRCRRRHFLPRCRRGCRSSSRRRLRVARRALRRGCHGGRHGRILVTGVRRRLRRQQRGRNADLGICAVGDLGGVRVFSRGCGGSYPFGLLLRAPGRSESLFFVCVFGGGDHAVAVLRGGGSNDRWMLFHAVRHLAFVRRGTEGPTSARTESLLSLGGQKLEVGCLAHHEAPNEN